MNFEIIYGDTDSIMINTNTDKIGEAVNIGLKIKKEINKQYKYLEIETDGIFQPLLLLRKKKYAALKLENLSDIINKISQEPKFTREMKGLDIVRRDWSEISKKASDFALEQILSKKSKDEVISDIALYLNNLSNFLIIFKSRN